MWSGNRFGFRGSEALGGGYSAIFTLEGRFSLDTGSVTYNESVNWCRAVRRDDASLYVPA